MHNHVQALQCIRNVVRFAAGDGAKVSGQEGKCVAGIQFAASTVLRLGVARSAHHILRDQRAGYEHGVDGCHRRIADDFVFVVVASVSKYFGLLGGGAVAICRVSAALAIAAVLPRGQRHKRDTTLAVIGVTALSTIAMVVYPVIVGVMGINSHQTGIFLGATIHGVAQVVGAGYSMGKDAGNTATIVKLLSVAMLLPVFLVLSLMFHERASATANAVRPPLLPWLRWRSACWWRSPVLSRYPNNYLSSRATLQDSP